jgi:hypothetical protein
MHNLNPDQATAIRSFAAQHGRYWKEKLRDVWLTDPFIPHCALLRQVRNQFGPAWLVKVKV